MAKGVFLKERRPDEDVNVQREPHLRILLQTALEIAEGMMYMHSQNILHCDLSRGEPSNCCSLQEHRHCAADTCP